MIKILNAQEGQRNLTNGEDWLLSVLSFATSFWCNKSSLGEVSTCPTKLKILLRFTLKEIKEYDLKKPKDFHESDEGEEISSGACNTMQATTEIRTKGVRNMKIKFEGCFFGSHILVSMKNSVWIW